MPTKAEIEALITAELASAQVGGIPAAKHRNTLKDDANSVLEAIYSDIIEETQTAPTITGSNANFNYIITISKVGRFVTINGNFRVLTASLSSEIFEIIVAEYLPKDNATQEGRAISQGGNSIRVFILDDSFRTGNTTFANELYFFSITYPVKD